MGTKKIKVISKIERKTYVKGFFTGKYHGDIDKIKSTFNCVNYYDIKVYEGELRNVKIITEKTYAGIKSEVNFLEDRFDNVISVTKAKIQNFDAFRFKLNSPKVKSISIKNVTKEDNQTFGTFTCLAYGYLLDIVDKEEEIEIQTCDSCKNPLELCACSPMPIPPANPIPLGNPIPPDIPKPLSKPINFDGCFEVFGWIFLIALGILILTIIGPKGIIALLVLTFIYLFLNYFSNIASFVFNLFYWLFRFFLLVLMFVFVVSLFSGIYSEITDSNQTSTKFKESEDSKEVKTKVVKEEDSSILISHHLIWKDYSNNLYEGNLSVLESDYYLSRQNRNKSQFELYNDYQWTLLYNDLITNDKQKLGYIYTTFDSIGNKNHLNRKQFAEMIVSCIQDIPYAFVLQDDCKVDSYEDISIKNKLEECPDCCIGEIKYGIQAPVEFIANLKGDCDTRTVILYTLLSKFGYDVAVLGSLTYQHSILAIKLPYTGIYKMIHGEKYYVWETTSTGFIPGIINPEISNMNMWNIHLLTNNN